MHTIELHPVSFGVGNPRGVRGTSRLATAEEGQKTIADLQWLSEPFGTNITYRDGIGMTALS